MKFRKFKYLLLNNLFLLANPDIEQNNQEKIDFAVGGQAVIEGVMMRSPNNISIAVRKKAGDIKVDKRNRIEYRHPLTKKLHRTDGPAIRDPSRSCCSRSRPRP